MSLNGLSVPVQYRPEVHVMVAGKRIATMPCGVLLEMELLKFAGQVVKGRLVQMHVETFNAAVSVTIVNKAVASRKVPLQLLVELPMRWMASRLSRAHNRSVNGTLDALITGQAARSRLRSFSLSRWGIVSRRRSYHP